MPDDKLNRLLSGPLVPCLWIVFDRMNVLNGMLYSLKGQTDSFLTGARRVLEMRKSHQGPDEVPMLLTWASLPVSDLTNWPEHEGQEHYASGGFGAQDEKYLALVEVLFRRNAAWTVAQGWEAHETFLLDILAVYLQERRGDADAQKLNNYCAKKRRECPVKPEEWRDFVCWAYRGNDNKKLLGYLRRLAPHLKEGETRNYRCINLGSWYRALAKVRHAVTHSGLRILPDQVRRMDQDALNALARFFPGAETDKGYELRMGAEETNRVLITLAEHAFLVFKGLSLEAGYDWEVLGKPRRITWANEFPG